MSEQIDLTALAFDKGWTLADTGKMYEHNLVAPDFSGPDWGGEEERQWRDVYAQQCNDLGRAIY